jgi:hypothetical protein
MTLRMYVGFQLVGAQQLMIAAVEWLQYVKRYDEISEVFDKYQNGTDFLDKDGLRLVRVC